MKPRCTPWYRPHQWPKWSAPENTAGHWRDGSSYEVATVHRSCERCGYFWMKEVG